MPLTLSNKRCDTCPSAQDPNLPGNCSTVGEVSNALNSSGVDKAACLARIQAMVKQFSGQVGGVTKV